MYHNLDSALSVPSATENEIVSLALLSIKLMSQDAFNTDNRFNTHRQYIKRQLSEHISRRFYKEARDYK